MGNIASSNGLFCSIVILIFGGCIPSFQRVRDRFLYLGTCLKLRSNCTSTMVASEALYGLRIIPASFFSFFQGPSCFLMSVQINLMVLADQPLKSGSAAFQVPGDRSGETLEVLTP